MVYRGTYALLLALHLVTVVFLVGPAVLAAMTSPRLVRGGRAEALRDAARSTRVSTLATVVVVALGTVLVLVSGGSSGAPQWSLGAVWVSASYALWFAAVVLTLLVVVPGQESAAEAIEGGTDASASAGRIAAGAGLAALCWTAIIVLMVYKPGA